MHYNYFVDAFIYGAILLTTYLILKKVFARSNIGILFLLSFITKTACLFLQDIMELQLVSSLADVVVICASVAVVISNEQKINKLMKRKKKSHSSNKAAEYDKKQFYKVITTTVNMLSSSKIGAIMTFEKGNSLDEYIKQGVKVNAPISSEILTTIFYPGTTLHDGAVIIRNDTIEAASVYYTPTVKAMNGKFGARHRAALGISEVCDAVTVVVSEETGHISLAIDGELIAVTRENFTSMFKEELEK